MAYLIVGVIMDLVVAAAGVVALVLAGRCARARGLIRLAGGVLILYALISFAWRVWSWYIFDFRGLPTDPAQEPLFEVHRTLAPVHSLVGTVVLVTGIVLIVIALVIRGRHEFDPARSHAAVGAGHAAAGDWRAAPQATGPRHGVPGAPPSGQPGASPQWDQGGQQGRHPDDAWNPSPSQDRRPAPGTGPQLSPEPPPHPPENPPDR